MKLCNNWSAFLSLQIKQRPTGAEEGGGGGLNSLPRELIDPEKVRKKEEEGVDSNGRK